MCGLEIAGKVAAFVEETEPVLLSTVVIRQPGEKMVMEGGKGGMKQKFPCFRFESAVWPDAGESSSWRQARGLCVCSLICKMGFMVGSIS